MVAIIRSRLILRTCHRVRWVHPESSGSLLRPLGVLRLIRDRWVYSRAPWGSLDLSEVVVFARTLPWGRWVHQGSLSSLAGALVVFGFIALDMSVVRFIWGRLVPGASYEDRLGHMGSLGSLTPALGVDRFIRGPWVHLRAPCCRWVCWRTPLRSLGSSLVFGFTMRALGVIGFIRGRCVRFSGPWGLLGSSEFVRFTCVCPFLGSSVVVGLTRAHTRGRWLLPGLLGRPSLSLRSSRFVGFTRARPEAIPVCWVCTLAPWGSLGSFWIVRLTCPPPGCRRVNPASFGTLANAVGVVRFIRVRWVHTRLFVVVAFNRGLWIPSSAPWGSSG